MVSMDGIVSLGLVFSTVILFEICLWVICAATLSFLLSFCSLWLRGSIGARGCVLSGLGFSVMRVQKAGARNWTFKRKVGGLDICTPSLDKVNMHKRGTLFRRSDQIIRKDLIK